MNEGRILGYRYLRDTVFEVIRIHDDISERTPFSSNVDVVFSADKCPDFTIEIDFRAISQLAHSFQVMETVDVAGNSDSLAELMAEVATMVNRSGLILVNKHHGFGEATTHESKIYM